ncbi:MAG TPA: discoidin domain-containing protein [Thermoanaerobaculia bacterium]|nr:discoidin domain-containing protein [Thermoanaerobaculia bacterium]
MRAWLAALLILTGSEVSQWTPAPSDGVSLNLANDSGALRMDFDFHGHGGWAAARRPVNIDVPENYRFVFRLRGEMPPNTLELKFIDGENVWWTRRVAWDFPREWTDVVAGKRHIEFAWGPATDHELKHISAIEVTVTAATGGKGSLWIDKIDYEPLPADTSVPLDGRVITNWTGDGPLTIDLHQPRDFGGLVVNWGADFASDYDVELSLDRKEWTRARRVAGGNGGRDYLQTPNANARFIRLSFAGKREIRDIVVQPPAFGDRAIDVYKAVAQGALRGRYPRGLIGEFGYWTIFGADAEEQAKPLLSEDGAIETSAGFTLEPFVRVDGRLITWADVTTTQSLEAGSLPMPSTTWHHPKFTMTVQAFGAGSARYRIRNTSGHPEHIQFFVAARPLRVTPPWHELNIPELTAPIRSIRWDAGVLHVDATSVAPSSTPDRVVLSTFDGGDASELFDAAASIASVDDPQKHASALLRWDFDLTAEKEIDLRFGGSDSLDAERAHWQSIADHVQIDIPAAKDLIDTVRANLAFNLLGRDGPAIRGGARNYRRSWIRDGSLASTALLRFGFNDQIRDYIRWFAQYQFADGKVPCCVDTRGADPVAEHDSHGEFIYLVAEYTRLTGDVALANEVWPHVEKAANYIDTIRKQTRGEAPHFAGLLPPSISHEGYSAKPMHSYWDDFWALRGLEDVTWLAERLGKHDAAQHFAAVRDEFSHDFHESIRRAIALHHIDYIPGSADLGDFDPTSTTIGIEPVGDLANLPHDAVIDEFTRYWNEASGRMNGTRPWRDYTPYELRNVGVFVRLGWRDRAQQLLQWFLDDRRPRGWKQWAEVVAQDYRSPTYVGDIPHLWVGSDFVRSFIDMLAYERESDQSLVLGAGIPEAWLKDGVSVRGLRTIYGPLTFSAKGDVVRVSGVQVPPGGVVLMLPDRETKVIRSVPATVTLSVR